MTRHRRALSESLLIHGMLAGTLVVMAGMVTPVPKMVHLDLSMLEQSVAPAPIVETKQEIVENHPHELPPKPVPVQEKTKPAPVKPRLVKPKIPSVAAVDPPTPPAQTASVPQPETAAANTEQSQGMPSEQTGTAVPVAGDQAIAAVKEYRRSNFSAIRDTIFANLRYPNLARRRGWSGKVDVSFVIKPDGSIGELQILSSSGYPLLDEQALDAIRQSGPFTPPRTTALLVMPVTFQLNDG